MTSEFVYLVRPVRPQFMESMTEEEMRGVDSHFEYLKAALERGILILAGPCLDAAFGVVIFRADSFEEAQKFMTHDPAVETGIFQAELHPYRVSLKE